MTLARCQSDFQLESTALTMCDNASCVGSSTYILVAFFQPIAIVISRKICVMDRRKVGQDSAILGNNEMFESVPNGGREFLYNRRHWRRAA